MGTWEVRTWEHVKLGTWKVRTWEHVKLGTWKVRTWWEDGKLEHGNMES